MKKIILFLVLLLSIQQLKSQSPTLSSVRILNEDSTLLLSPDTSYIFNAYVVTQILGGISSVTVSCADYVNDSTWTPVKDTVYSWSSITNPQSGFMAYAASKPNNNLLRVCLGRLHYAQRQRFIFLVAGSNGIITKEFFF